MAVKYRLEYPSLGGYETRIDIDKAGYSGSILPMTGSANPFELVYEASDEYQFAPFKNSYCLLEVRETPELVNDFKEIEDEDNFVLRYYRSGSLNWSGYVMQEQYVESDDINQPLQLRFYDGISRLKIFNFTDLGLVNKSTYSLTEIFQAVDSLLYTNLGGTRGFYFNDFLVNTLNTSTKLTDLLFIQKISTEDKDGIVLNLYKVLENIAASFNFTYLLYKNRFVVTNFEYSDNPKFVDFSNVSKPVLSFNKRRTVTNEFVNISKETTFNDSLKKMEVVKKYDFPLTFSNINDYDNIQFTSSLYATGSANELINDRIRFNSFIYTNDLLDGVGGVQFFEYRSGSISNTTTIDVNKPDDYVNDDGEFVLEFKYRFNYTLNKTPTSSLEITGSKTLIDNTELRLMFNMRGLALNDLDVETNHEYLYDGWNNQALPSTPPYQVGVFQLENFFNGTDLSLLDTEERTFRKSYTLRNGMNKLTIKFFQPYIHIPKDMSGNPMRYSTVRLDIYDIRLVRTDRERLSENIWTGTTDRNVFNYNLNRNKEVFYINNLDEKRYPFNLLSSTNTLIPLKSFKRRNKTYSANRTETFDLYELVLNQSLEQFGLQQMNVRGEMLIKDSNFDIFSSLSINGVIFSIHKFTLNDYEGIHSVELIEIK